MLKEAGVEVSHFDGVIPNPTTENVTAGADMAKAHEVVTNTSLKYKSAIFNPIIFPRVGIIDPELMLIVPEHISPGT